MNRLFQATLVAAALLVGLHGTAVAEDVPEAKRVVLVDFDTQDVEADVMDQFYGHLRNTIADVESMGFEEHGDFSMDDLWLMAGCSSTDADCLALLSDFVDGDQLLFGSVEQVEGVHTFSITLFDFQASENVLELPEQTISGDDQWIADAVPAVVEHFIFGETGSVAVEVTGASDAEISLDGEVIGTGSATVDDVAPGEAKITAQTEDEILEERVIVRHDDTVQVEFEFAAPMATIDDPDYDSPSLVPGLAAVGAGVVGLGIGVVGQTQLSSARSEADDRTAGGVFDGDPARAHDLQSDMDSANTLRFIGFTGGAIGLATGGALLFRALTAKPAGDDGLAMDRSIDLDIGASSDGVNAGFRLDF